MKHRKRIFLLFTLLCMSAIFAFSARPAEVSSQDSGRVGRFVGSVLNPDFESWTIEEQMEFAEKIDYPVRKTAHFTEYFILGALILGAVMENVSVRSFAVSWAAGTLYAVTDELHQRLVPGRSGQISDVLLDSMGVCCGVAAGLIWCWWRRNRPASRIPYTKKLQVFEKKLHGE